MRWEDEVEDEVEQYSYFKISCKVMLLHSKSLRLDPGVPRGLLG